MSSTDLKTVRQQLLLLIDHVLEAVSAKELFQQQRNKLLSHPRISELLNANTRRRDVPLTLIAIGKMADALASEFVNTFGIVNVRGVVSSPYESTIPPIDGLNYFRGGHPIPNDHSMKAAQKAMDLLADVAQDEPVVYLISGGGSACFEIPEQPLELQEMQEIYRMLVGCGADIGQINRVRQKLSQVKGGKLAAACRSQKQLALIVSDVKTGQLQFVSSGPTIGFETEPKAIETILSQHKIEDSFSTAAKDLLMGQPKPMQSGNLDGNGDCESICLGSNDTAVNAAASFCQTLGWRVKVERRFDEQPIPQATAGLIDSLSDLQAESGDTPACVVAGGEVISKVIGSGRGGRNQAFVLDCVPKIADGSIVVLSFGTDGIDGNSPAAGAVADGQTAAIASAAKMQPSEFAANSDSYHFFESLGDAVVTGPTQINLRDVRVLVRLPEQGF